MRAAWLSNLIAALWLLFAPWLMAADEVAIPPLKARVSDLTGTLQPGQQAALEQTLQSFEARKGSQVAILIVPSTQPETIEQYAIRVAENWKLGRKGVDDGVLLLVAKNDRKLRIEVGYGLEGVIPDAVAKRIVSEVIAPRFKQGDFYGGIQAGVDRILRVIEGEPLPEPETTRASNEGGGSSDDWLGLAFFATVIIGGVLRALFGRFFGGLIAGSIAAALAWLLFASLTVMLLAGFVVFFITLVAGHNRGGWSSGGGWGSGGGWSGGGGGGGFSGGGGGFGGGGASGDW